jgi:FkbM family methyltransferase
VSIDPAVGLRKLRKYLYRGPVLRVARRLRLNRLLSGPFWWLVYRTSKDRSHHTIAGHDAVFAVDSPAEYHRFDDLADERPVIANLLNSMEETDVFYDIGANVGTYACFAASKLGSERVVAFEPEPRNVDRLAENLRLNGYSCEVVAVAATDYDGTAELMLRGTEAGEGTHTLATDEGSDSISVPAVKIDSVTTDRDLPPPTVVKIDVEGAELSVLRGMQETLERHCRLVYVEVHPDRVADFGGSIETVRELLEQAGFQLDELGRRGEQTFLRASK